jgi:hypothetical protein
MHLEQFMRETAMYDTIKTIPGSRVVVGEMTRLATPGLQSLMTLGKRRGWGFTYVGQAPLPKKPLRIGQWLIIPAHQDSSPIPRRARERVHAIFSSGISPHGFVLAHEVPRRIAAPARQNRNGDSRHHVLSSELRSSLKRAGAVIGSALLGLAVINGIALLAVIAVAAAGILLLPLVLVTCQAGVDPKLIAVVDGHWVVVDEWIEGVS